MLGNVGIDPESCRDDSGSYTDSDVPINLAKLGISDRGTAPVGRAHLKQPRVKKLSEQRGTLSDLERAQRHFFYDPQYRQ